MRRLWFAALAAVAITGAAPAYADHDRRDDRYMSQREAQWAAAERTRRAQIRNSERVMAETRRRQAANTARMYREARARQRDDTYDHAYYDDSAYARGRRDAEREFRRFADRNRDGHVSRREYQWAIARW